MVATLKPFTTRRAMSTAAVANLEITIKRYIRDSTSGMRSVRWHPSCFVVHWSVRMSQTSQVVVITGASAGLGRATARAFARRGAAIGLIARGIDGLEATAREVIALGGRALVLPLDVSDADAIESAAARVEEVLGPIDVWVNNAMVSVFSPIAETTPEEYRRVTEVTYLGYVYGSLAALKRMRTRNRGTIIQVGSALAYRGIPLQSAYCGAKHAIQGFTDSLYSELIHDKSDIHVCMIQLPAMNTPQFGWVKSRLPGKAQPVPPIYQPEGAAEVIVWATQHRRREINVGWPTVKAIWGNNLVPGYADHYLAWHGYEDQQSDEPEDPGRRDNLWEPVPGDHGSRGRFSEEATAASPELWMSLPREWLLAGVAVAGLAFG
jgi:NAD(P)-dependent dehydrogenase (short-subunit alcohol dehydrogenase family)